MKTRHKADIFHIVDKFVDEDLDKHYRITGLQDLDKHYRITSPPKILPTELLDIRSSNKSNSQ